MKQKFLFGCCGLLWLLLVLGTKVFAQDGFDVTKHVADPNSRKFDDGKTTVESYLLYALEKQTACCGEDNVYMQVKFDGTGCVTFVRALSGKSECMKQSAEDLLRVVKWTVEDPDKPRPAIFPVKISILCDDSKDNVYAKINPPAGFKPCGSGGTAAGTDTKAGNETGEKQIGMADGESGGNSSGGSTGGNTGGSAGGKKPVAGNTDNSPPSKNPPLSRQAGKDTPAALRDSSLLNKLKPKELPQPKYVSRGNLNPDSAHVGTILNEQGPRIKSPEFVDGKAGLGVYIKTVYRKLGVCGVVNVTAELTIESDGSVSAFRIFHVNDDKVAQATPFLLGSMKFRPLPFQEHFLLQYKSDVDCAGYPKNNLDQVNFYFTVPNKPSRVREADPKVTPPDDTLETPVDN